MPVFLSLFSGRIYHRFIWTLLTITNFRQELIMKALCETKGHLVLQTWLKENYDCLLPWGSFAGDWVESKYCAAERINKPPRINWNLFHMSRCPPPGWAVWSDGSEGLSFLSVSSGLCPCFLLPQFLWLRVLLDSKRILVSASLN